ncbi:hypothetical protein EGJ57_16380 [Brucella anthropi]|uniref:hypothetical protein n=1 Tax=Brucella anthropi TaxID=529 RepID=UPI000F674FAC|nr:hypothetical protein [Brucella anthropi]RRY17927.1 hypothetical protein EGJ57_16380 [Brucella anthropi]
MDQELLGTRWRHKKRGTSYRVFYMSIEDLASRCKDGDSAFLWMWSDPRNTYVLIAPNKPQASIEATFTMKLPLTVQMSDDTSRYGTIIVYQAENDGSIWARYADEFLDGRFERLSE